MSRITKITAPSIDDERRVDYAFHDSARNRPIEAKEEVVDLIIQGAYGAGQERKDQLAAEGWDPEELQDMVNERLGIDVKADEYELKEGQEYTMVYVDQPTFSSADSYHYDLSKGEQITAEEFLSGIDEGKYTVQDLENGRKGYTTDNGLFIVFSANGEITFFGWKRSDGNYRGWDLTADDASKQRANQNLCRLKGALDRYGKSFSDIQIEDHGNIVFDFEENGKTFTVKGENGYGRLSLIASTDSKQTGLFYQISSNLSIEHQYGDPGKFNITYNGKEYPINKMSFYNYMNSNSDFYIDAYDPESNTIKMISKDKKYVYIIRGDSDSHGEYYNYDDYYAYARNGK